MTLQLSKFKAYGLRCEGENRQRVQQVVEMYITAAATDTAWDISSDTAGALGTFWTAAVADAKYGTLATSALAVIRKIAAVALSMKDAESEAFLNRTKISGAGLLSFLSSASAGGAAAETYTVTGLLATDTVVAVTPKLVAATRPVVKTFLSNASAGGAAAEAYTVTGLLATDTIIAVTPQTAAATRPEVKTFLSSAYGGGSATPTVVVTGLLATDTIISVSQVVKGSNNLPLLGYNTIGADSLHLVYSADPGTTSQVEVTVLRSSGAGFVADPYVPVSYGAPGAASLTVTYGGDPGAGAKVEVTVLRSAGAGFVADPVTPVSYGSAGAGTLVVTYGGDPGVGAKVEVLAYRPAAASSVPGVGQYGIAISGHLPALTFGTADAPTTMHLRMNWTLPDSVEAYVSDLGTAF